MGKFVVEEGRFGGLPTVRVVSDSGASAEIALRGATLLSWDPGLGELAPGGLIDGYRDEEELISQNGVRSGVMTPFSNRVRAARYSFDGTDHDMLPGVADPDRLIYHGYLRLLDTTVVATETGEDGATVRLAAQVRPGDFDGYPFAIDIEVSYTFRPTGMTMQIVGRNVGDAPAPYGSGWHPYFRLGAGRVDPLELRVPARTQILTDEALIPLPGEDAYQPIGEGEWYRSPRPLGDTVLDHAFADLEADADGLARTVLRDPGTGNTLTIWQSRGLMHVFTGDTLARDCRASIALEPVEVMTDAFNRPECAAAVRLEPGAEREFTFGVDVGVS